MKVSIIIIIVKSLSFDSKLKKHFLSKLISITIRCTYYIFCYRNKPWKDPDFLDISLKFYFVYNCYLLYHCCCCFCGSFLFSNPDSQLCVAYCRETYDCI